MSRVVPGYTQTSYFIPLESALYKLENAHKILNKWRALKVCDYVNSTGLIKGHDEHFTVSLLGHLISISTCLVSGPAIFPGRGKTTLYVKK